MSQLFNTNNGYADEDALSMVNDASSAILQRLTPVWVSQGYITSVIVLMNEDRQKVEAAAEFMRKAEYNTRLLLLELKPLTRWMPTLVPYRATVLKMRAPAGKYP